MTEQIEHPTYYNVGGIEVADFIEAYELNFNLGNVVKYVSRAGRKCSESPLTALQKAHVYLSRELGNIERKQEYEAQIMEGMRPAIYDPDHYPEDAEQIKKGENKDDRVEI